MNYQALFADFKNIKVAVMGDVMLDTYWWGRVDRISPEAPVPVVAVERKEFRLGGAANVALNLSSLGAQVHILTVTGDDDDEKELVKMMAEKKIDTSGICKTTNRITTNKIRIISRNQHMMRLDKEMNTDLLPEDEQIFLQKIIESLTTIKPQILIFEDYNKGVLTQAIITQTITFCQQQNILTAVDPKRKNFFAYQGVNIFKPNLKEVYEAFNIIDTSVNEANLKAIHALLFKKLHHHISFITLSEKGVFFQEGESYKMVPAHIRNIADVSGAGDTVIAVAALVYSITKNKTLMAQISNIAGGIVCEEVGTAAINPQKLMAECELLLG